MAKLPGRLGTLRAHDIMTGKVVVLSEEDTIQEAANTVIEQRISGAPVVNNQGVLVGMLSLTDIAQPRPAKDATKEPAKGNGHGPRRFHTDDGAHWELLRPLVPPSGEGAELVKDRMTRHLVSVPDTTPLVEIARVMCRDHLHRVVVVDKRGAVCGIVSTMDVLAALVNVVDEANA